MSIHQETLIPAAPSQVYELLTEGSRFSAATDMAAQITDREGDSFSLFAGRIEGRQIELVPWPAEWIEHISLGDPNFYQDPIARFITEGPSRGLPEDQ
jgi:hypothetical protein